MDYKEFQKLDTSKIYHYSKCTRCGWYRVFESAEDILNRLNALGRAQKGRNDIRLTIKQEERTKHAINA